MKKLNFMKKLIKSFSFIIRPRDVLIIKVEQVGGISCHTGRTSCFYKVLKNDEWISIDPVIKDPKEIYK